MIIQRADLFGSTDRKRTKVESDDADDDATVVPKNVSVTICKYANDNGFQGVLSEEQSYRMGEEGHGMSCATILGRTYGTSPKPVTSSWLMRIQSMLFNYLLYTPVKQGSSI